MVRQSRREHEAESRAAQALQDEKILKASCTCKHEHNLLLILLHCLRTIAWAALRADTHCLVDSAKPLNKHHALVV